MQNCLSSIPKCGPRRFRYDNASRILPKEEISECVEDFYERMIARSRSMKEMPNYKTGENYAYLGLPPNFLIFDEYVAYMGANRFPTSIE